MPSLIVILSMQFSFFVIIPIVLSHILSNSVSNKSGTSIITILLLDSSLASLSILGTTYFKVILSTFSFFSLSKNITSENFFLSISKSSPRISFPNSFTISL